MAEPAERPALHERLILALLNRVGAGDRGRRLAGGAAGAFVMKLASLLGAFVISVLLSRTLGATGFGAYAFAIAWIQLLLVVALLGTDRLLVREVAARVQLLEWGLLRGLLRRSQQGVLLASLLLALLLGWILSRGEPGSDTIDRSMLVAVWIALPLLPLFAWTRVRQTILLGLDRVTVSQAPDQLIQPWLFILFALLLLLIAPASLSVNSALLLQIAAAVLAFAYAFHLSRRHLPVQVRKAKVMYQTPVWLRATLPMLAVAGIQVINMRVDILMVGGMMGAEAAGLYTVANRGAQLVLLVYFAVNAALAPTVAALHSQRDRARMQDVVRKATRITFLGSLPIALALIIGGRWFLQIFGSEFVAGYTALVILSTGQMIVVFFGAVGTVLLMTNHERQAAIGAASSAVLNIVLNLLLIPHYGMTGAAWAFFAGQGSAALLMAILVRKKVGITPSAL